MPVKEKGPHVSDIAWQRAAGETSSPASGGTSGFCQDMINGTVFLVDDDPAVRDSLTLLLELDNLMVFPFDSAEGFLGSHTPTPESCAIVDLRMPGIGGIALQEEMAKRGIRLPIIFLTGHGDREQKRRALEFGAADFLTKPVARDTLLSSVYAALATAHPATTEAAGSPACYCSNSLK